MSLLETIRDPSQLRSLSREEELQLCAEIRSFLVEHVSRTGGHLASNLGVVELTLALEKNFDLSRDRLVFDVGHQCYVHKLLTGRQEGFETLRSFGGMAGFPKPCESPYDAFIAGHASAAVSAALGLARARTRSGSDHSVIALLGDGALTGGLAYEALNDAGQSGEPLIVILNDNGMSIDKNVGSVARHLAQLRLKPRYFHIKQAWREMTKRIPGGAKLYRWSHAIKQRLKRFILGSTIFESMGFTYVGPVDGHDLEKVSYLLQVSKQLNCPVLMHVITKKGKGYPEAEAHPERYHGLSPQCDTHTGEYFSAAFGDELLKLAKQDPKLVAITAAMPGGTGLHGFSQALPGQIVDVGIAEGHAVTMASGMAAGGMRPVVAIYSSFLQRAYDMILQDAAMMGNHVVFAVDRAGLVGEDGETHHGVFDVSYLRSVPGMQVFCPATPEELRAMLRKAIYDCQGPVALRYPRDWRVNVSTPDLLCEKPDLTIGCYGTDYFAAAECASMLRKQGICADVVRLPMIKPLPMESLTASVKKSGRLLFSEQVVSSGCVGQQVLEELALSGLEPAAKLSNLGDCFTTHGSMKDLLRFTGLDAEGLYRSAMEVMDREPKRTN